MRHWGRACGWALRPLGQLLVLSIYSAGVWALRTGPGLCLQPPPQGEELIPRPGLSRSCARPPGPRGPGWEWPPTAWNRPDVPCLSLIFFQDHRSQRRAISGITASAGSLLAVGH